MSQTFDLAIVGGGIVGLATAYQVLQREPGLSLLLLEKETKLAKHQTGHNSGVLHSGIYYKPGSLKAVNCREGKLAMQGFCERYDIDFDICGKVIVAVDESELDALNRIYERGQANGVQCEVIGRERLLELEPHVAGIKAIHVPEAGIVNYRQVCEKLGELFEAAGGRLALGESVKQIRQSSGGIEITTSKSQWLANRLVNCAGLQSDRVCKMGGKKPSAKIIPFRGEYFELKPEREELCRNLIYPVPDPKFPFLGVHFTRMIEGGVECGPNAVLAFAREGYTRTTINVGDLAESLTYGGFIKMAMKHWKMGCGELWRSFSKKAFVKALQRLMPEIKADDLAAAPAGVRAQAVAADGKLVDDFLIDQNDAIINVCNAPSPAATASFNIGKLVAQRVLSHDP